MASFRRRTLRSAHVACAPPLARIHERIFQALGVRESGELGRPGGSCLFVSQLGGIEDVRNTQNLERPTEVSEHDRESTNRGRKDVFPSGGGDGLSSRETGASTEVLGLEYYGIDYFAKEWLSKLESSSSVANRGDSRTRKSRGPSVTDDGGRSARAVTTWERFDRAEQICFEVNQRSKEHWRNSPFSQEIILARKLASRILGPFDWDQAARCFGWGPGATTRLTRRESDAAHKYSGSPHATIGNAVLANTVIRWSPLWAQGLPVLSEVEGLGYCKIVPGNRVVTVPKNYKTDRTIAIEPDMNIYIQKGIGGVIRSRLRAIGVNLDDQTKNQRLAEIGSFSGRLATIDLSMASDCISRTVVEKLIRSDWLDALGQCRSPFGVLPSGKKIFYQKFSSMGNGYTFELETLIFLSLALAYARIHGEEVNRISVYGDDIIVPSTMAAGFCGLLQFMGFTPNDKKSYWTGPFRESCGKHYYSGYDITPFYVKKTPKTLIDLFKIHNQIWRYVDRCVWLGPERRRELLGVCKWLRSYAPASWRMPSLVDGFGDGGFVGYFDEVLPQRAKHGWDGYCFKTVLEQPILDESIDHHGLLVKGVARIEGKENPSDGRSNLQPLYSSLPSSACYVLSGHGRLLLKDDDAIEVYPVRGRRYVEGKIFVSASQLRRQCTGLFAP